MDGLHIDRRGMAGEVRPIVDTPDGVMWTTEADPAAEFGLYQYDADGLAVHVDDFPTREQAVAAATELGIVPLYQPEYVGTALARP